MLVGSNQNTTRHKLYRKQLEEKTVKRKKIGYTKVYHEIVYSCKKVQIV